MQSRVPRRRLRFVRLPASVFKSSLGLFLGLACGGSVLAAVSPDQLAAQYYYSRNDYQNAFPLWKKVLAEQPENPTALARVAELSLWLEGRGPFLEVLAAAAQDPRNKTQKTEFLRAKLWQLQTLFLNDESLALYLQALQRSRVGDRMGAWNALKSAALSDPGQFTILLEKAKIERELGMTEAYYQTLQQAYHSYPLDRALVTELAKAHLYFRNYQALFSVLGPPGETQPPEQRALLAIAWADAGARSKALTLLRRLAAKRSVSTPVVYFSLGEMLAQTPALRDEARRWFVRFIHAVGPSAEHLGWDPYHTRERLAHAREWLSHYPSSAERHTGVNTI